ncbi:hypothetical protein QTJ16_006389 [Diplocarpon rosae]|uniref:Uncharacterized protein n=1 Tax=Diplocarpon rosae TaxID=946125 RepID=A0AAD9WD38_9HELO|nr:hypothetical protein QTJ16_006389 [Diplocarpon rosae]
MSCRRNQTRLADQSTTAYSLPFPLPTQDDVLGYLLAGAKRRAIAARKQAAAERRRLATQKKKKTTLVGKVVAPLTMITRSRARDLREGAD